MTLESGMSTHIEEDRDEHQSGIERDQRSIFHQAILIEQALLDNSQEIVVEAGIN